MHPMKNIKVLNNKLYSILLITLILILFSLDDEVKSEDNISAQDNSIHEITVIKNKFSFNPTELTIKVGESVKWNNTDVRRHHFASIPGSGTSDELEIFHLFEAGDSWTHTFSTPGEYPYFCFIHNQMRGKIIVVNENKGK